MRRLSLQWRITLMTALLVCVMCVLMNCLIGYSGMRYMDSIGSGISACGDIGDGAAASFDPDNRELDEELTIVVSNAQESFSTTNWLITIAVTLLGGVLAYFVSGRALRPLRAFASQVENVQPSNLADMKISEDVLPEFKQFSKSFNSMIDRLDEGFSAHGSSRGTPRTSCGRRLHSCRRRSSCSPSNTPTWGLRRLPFSSFCRSRPRRCRR